ncbi:hypothetical protein COB64_02070 [Candidatus Wolfebacteria bacterium]|nr:MAG: hypothetical protein COB64_02070 [Candidatus Wolfebacteria bacterium]
MNTSKFTIFFIALTIFFVAQTTFAQSLLRPFGGKIISTKIPGVKCAAQHGVIAIVPVALFPPAPYIITATKKVVSPGQWILGLYNPILTPGSCFTTTTPPVPVPTFSITLFGVSMR